MKKEMFAIACCLLDFLACVCHYYLMTWTGSYSRVSEQGGSPQLAAKPAAFSSIVIRTEIRSVQTSCRL
jgi:hypothetical protein